MWHLNTADPGKSFFQNLANQYHKAHPNVQFKITILENASYKQKLTTVMQSGSPPDLFGTWGGGVLFQYANAGLVQDISSYLHGSWGSSFDQSVLNSIYSQNGKYYAVPTDNGAVVFWYNKALFTKAGITTPPTTWTEFLQTVKKLQAAGITPLALGEGEKWPGMYYWAYLCTRIGGKAAFQKAYSRSGGSFTDPPFVEAGQRLQELAALNPFQKGFLGSTYPNEGTVMGNDHAAMELMGQWAPAVDQGAATNKKGPDLGIFPFPTVEGGAGNPTDVMGGGGGFAIGKNAPIPETVDFLKFMTSPANITQMVKLGVSVPPMPVAEALVTDPLRRELDSMAAAAPYLQLYYDQYLPPAVGQVLLDQTQALFAGTATPQAAAKAIDDSAASSLNQ
jgi:raffinose/stachyose/melibiose transport system substrate-binding protein